MTYSHLKRRPRPWPCQCPCHPVLSLCARAYRSDGTTHTIVLSHVRFRAPATCLMSEIHSRQRTHTRARDPLAPNTPNLLHVHSPLASVPVCIVHTYHPRLSCTRLKPTRRIFRVPNASCTHPQHLPSEMVALTLRHILTLAFPCTSERMYSDSESVHAWLACAHRGYLWMGVQVWVLRYLRCTSVDP